MEENQKKWNTPEIKELEEENEIKKIEKILEITLEENGKKYWIFSSDEKISDSLKNKIKSIGYDINEKKFTYDNGYDFDYKIFKSEKTTTLSIPAKKVENNKIEIDKIHKKIETIKKSLLEINKDGKVDEKELLKLKGLDKQLGLLKGKDDEQEKVILEIKYTLTKLKEIAQKTKIEAKENDDLTTKFKQVQEKNKGIYGVEEEIKNGENGKIISNNSKKVNVKELFEMTEKKDLTLEDIEKTETIDREEIITDSNGNPLNKTDSIEKIEQTAEKLESNIQEVAATGNLEKTVITQEEAQQLHKNMEKTGTSDSMIAKLLKVLESFLNMFNGKKFNAYLDKNEGLVVEGLRGEAKEKFYDKNTKYNETFKTILEKSGYEKAIVVLAEEKKIKPGENPFALELDTNGKNLFLQTIEGQDYSKDNAKIIMSYKDKYGNFQTQEVLLKNLEKTVKKYDENHGSLDHVNSSHSINGELNIDKYIGIKDSLNQAEKQEYLKGVKSGIITDVIYENNENKFKILGKNEYVSKGEMLNKIVEMDNNPKLFWEGYLNILGIRLNRNERSSEYDNIKIVIDLPGNNDFIYVDNGKSKTIFEYNNGNIIKGDVLGIDGMQVAGLYPEQIIMFAHAMKNNISLKSMKEFHYSEIKTIFSGNKNLSNLKILDPKSLNDKTKSITSLEKPY